MEENKKPQSDWGKDFNYDFNATYDLMSIIPHQLAGMKRFVCFSENKTPLNVHNGKYGSSTDSSTWGTLEQALSAVEKYPQAKGVGIVLGATPLGNLCGLDIDGCIDDEGNIAPEAQELIDLLDSYTEISISGTGIHVLFFGKKNTDKCKNTNLSWCKALELYDCNRYFTISGRRLDK